jgi:hypothetical protein
MGLERTPSLGVGNRVKERPVVTRNMIICGESPFELKKLEKMALVEGVDYLNLHRRSKKGLEINFQRYRILGTWGIEQKLVEVLL